MVVELYDDVSRLPIVDGGVMIFNADMAKKPMNTKANNKTNWINALIHLVLHVM